jgi:hypothetical protein
LRQCLATSCSRGPGFFTWRLSIVFIVFSSWEGKRAEAGQVRMRVRKSSVAGSEMVRRAACDYRYVGNNRSGSSV